MKQLVLDNARSGKSPQAVILQQKSRLAVTMPPSNSL